MKVKQKKILPKKSNLPYYMAPDIIRQVESSKKNVMKADQDLFSVVTGREGSGKSTFAIQLAYAYDKTLSLDDIVFNGKQFKDRLRYFATKNIKHKSIIFDEAFHGLSSKGALSKMNKELVRLLMECRQLNLFVFIILPSIFLLEKYVAIFRSNVLYNVYTSKKDISRRYIKLYNYENKKTLYIHGQKYLSYSYPFINNSHRFYGKFPPTVDKDEYDTKKLKAFQEEEKELTPKEVKTMNQRNFLLYLLHKKAKMRYTEISKDMKEAEFDVDPSVIGRYIRDVTQKRQKTTGTI